MAHEFESGMFVGQGAWHRLGVVLQEPPTVEEAIQVAGLDWTVELEPVYLSDGRMVSERRAVVRSSDRSVLGTVGPEYEPLQNHEAFAWFNPFLAERNVALETAGSLRGGRRVWVQARVRDEAAEVAPGDVVRPFLLLYTGHDGTLSVGVQFSVTRVVCMNTLRAARGEGGIIKVRHTAAVREGLAAVRETVDLVRRTFSASVEQYRAMQRRALGVEGLEAYIRKVLEVPADAEKLPRAWDQILENFEAGAGAETHRGTVWGAYNAVTEWTGSQRGKDEESRLDSTWFGTAAGIRGRAHEEAVALL